MSNKPKYWNRAKRILSKKDKVMRKLINNYKDKSLVTRNDVFYSLCKSITGQQLSIFFSAPYQLSPTDFNYLITLFSSPSLF